METKIDFLVRHTEDTIELYARGERDLTQTIAEIEDNQQLGLTASVLRRIMDEEISNYIKGTNEKRHERLALLKSKLISQGRIGA